MRLRLAPHLIIQRPPLVQQRLRLVRGENQQRQRRPRLFHAVLLPITDAYHVSAKKKRSKLCGISYHFCCCCLLLLVLGHLLVVVFVAFFGDGVGVGRVAALAVVGGVFDVAASAIVGASCWLVFVTIYLPGSLLS